MDRIGPVVDENLAVERRSCMPPASCTKRSAAARSQSWPLPPATAASSSPWATRASRSASEWMRGIGNNAGPACNDPVEHASWARRRGRPSSPAPELAWIAMPLRVAPPPAVERNSSSVTGANRAATTGRPSITSATDTDQSSRPAMKARVPSIGSTTQTRRAASRVGSFSLSSDSQPSPGFDQMLVQQIVGGDVGLGDRGIALPLRPLLQRAAEEFFRNGAGLRAPPWPAARGRAEAQTPAMVSPSRRKVGALVP